MSTRRRVRLARTVTVVVVLAYVLPRVWAWWAGLDPWERSSAGLFVAAVVLTVWGVAACLREYRAEQERKSRDRHPAGRARA